MISDSVTLVLAEDKVEATAILANTDLEGIRVVKVSAETFDKVERFLMPCERYANLKLMNKGLFTLVVNDKLISKFLGLGLAADGIKSNSDGKKKFEVELADGTKQDVECEDVFFFAPHGAGARFFNKQYIVKATFWGTKTITTQDTVLVVGPYMYVKEIRG